MTQLRLTHEERSDNKAIIFTDTTNWSNIAEARTAGPGLQLTVTRQGGTTYTIPNSLIVAALTTATTVGPDSDIKYTITQEHLGGASGDIIPDDVYSIAYTHASHTDYTRNILVYGVAKQKVWQGLAMNDDVHLQTRSFSPQIEEALTNYAFLLDLESSTFCAQISELKRILELLNNLT